jgi:poly-gamma-glutamate capsule biosynthesis protein CapA/YwtB (metallophosphatase superfamily)
MAIRAAVAMLALVAVAEPDPAAATTLVWGGDTTLGSSYGQPPARGWPQLARVAAVLRSADVAAVNLEGTFGSSGASKCGAGRPNCFAFHAPPANARTLARAGVDVVNQANNHAYDFGPAGWRATRAALRTAGVRYAGAPGEVRVARGVAFTGFSTYHWSGPMSDYAAVRRTVRAAARRARIVVAMFHAGAEGAGALHVPFGRERAFGEDRGDSRRFARVAIDAGADLVLGSGPHVLRGMEIHRGRLIAYSLGNLTGWRNFATTGVSGLTALLRVRLAPNGRIRRGAITSLRLDGIGVPRIDRARRAARLMRRLSRSDFPAGDPWRYRLGRVQR